MIKIVTSEATNASDNLSYILIHECQCSRRICYRRVLIGASLTSLFVAVIVFVSRRSQDLGHEVFFSISSFCIVMAALLLLCTFCQCRHLVFRPTGRPVLKRLLYFDKNDLDALRRFVDGQNADDEDPKERLALRATGPVMLCVVYTDDGQMAFCRLMQYEGFGYVPVGPDRFYTGADAERMRRFVRRLVGKR